MGMYSCIGPSPAVREAEFVTEHGVLSTSDHLWSHHSHEPQGGMKIYSGVAAQLDMHFEGCCGHSIIKCVHTLLVSAGLLVQCHKAGVGQKSLTHNFLKMEQLHPNKIKQLIFYITRLKNYNSSNMVTVHCI